MKRSKMLFLGVIASTCISGLLPLKVDAEQVVAGEGQTPVTIKVVQSPIYLVGVEAPKFGTYELTGKNQRIQATSDLVINVQDTRTETSSPWQIDYELSFFENTSTGQQANATLKYTVGEGTLKVAGQTADKSVYQTQEVELGQEKRSTLVESNLSGATNYEYRVPKEKIGILIPENTAAGEYKAIQTIHLISIPESE